MRKQAQKDELSPGVKGQYWGLNPAILFPESPLGHNVTLLLSVLQTGGEGRASNQERWERACDKGKPGFWEPLFKKKDTKS